MIVQSRLPAPQAMGDALERLRVEGHRCMFHRAERRYGTKRYANEAAVLRGAVGQLHELARAGLVCRVIVAL